MDNVSKWSVEREEQLIELWQERPCLCDIGSKDYANRMAKRKAIDEIADKLSTSGEAVNKRLHALRTQYARVCKLAPSGSGAVKTTGRQQWLLNKLQFLKTYVKTKPSTSNLLIKEDEDENSSFNDTSALSTTEELESMDANPMDDSEPADDSRSNEVPNNNLSQSVPPMNKKLKRLASKHAGPLKRAQKKQSEEALAVLKSLAAAVAAQNNERHVSKEAEEDEDVAFGRYIVTELRSMSDKRSKLIVKHAITNAIFNAKISSLQEPQLLSQMSSTNARRQQSQPPSMQGFNASAVDG